MTQKRALIAVATVLGFAGVTACNKNSPPAQTTADQTQTTGATAPEPYNQPSQPAQPSPTDQAGMGTAPSTGGASENVPANPTTTTPGVSASGGTTSAETPSQGGSASLNDAQIVAIVQAANSGEIEQAREALRKAKDPKVKRFAQHMVTDHSAAETQISSVENKAELTPQSNAIAGHLKTNGEEIMSNLRSASSGLEFDKAYIDAQVKEHAKVLELLDNKLISRAHSPELVSALQDIRSKVAIHLQDAQEIQSSLENK